MMVAVTRAVWWLLPLATNIHALRTVVGSPCTSVCGTTTNTTSNEIVCVDSYYNTTQTGRNFKSCVSCLLDSPFQNTTSGETDVDWGLCMYFEISNNLEASVRLIFIISQLAICFFIMRVQLPAARDERVYSMLGFMHSSWTSPRNAAEPSGR